MGAWGDRPRLRQGARRRLRALVAVTAALVLFGGTAWAATFGAAIANNSSTFNDGTQQLEGTTGASNCYSTGTGSGGTVFLDNYSACTSGNPLPSSLSTSATNNTDTLTSAGTTNGDKAGIASGGTGIAQVTDTTGNDTLLAEGGVTYQASGPRSSQAVTLNGSTGWLESTNSANNPNNISEVLWFKTTTNGYASGGMLMELCDDRVGATQAPNHDRQIWMDNSGKIVYGVYNGATQEITSASAYNNAAWHMLVAEIGSAGMKVYIDGSSVGTNTATSAQNIDGWWELGAGTENGWADGATSNYFAGSIAQAAVFPSQLTSTQVSTLYSTDTTLTSYTQGVNALSPTDYWPVNDTGNAAWAGPVPGTVSGSSAPDVSGTGDTGTDQGTQWTNYSTDQAGPSSLSSSSSVGFDGSSGYTKTATAYTPTTEYPSAMTLALWVKTNTGSGGGLAGFDASQLAGGTDNSSQGWPLFMDTSGHLYFGTDGNSTWDDTESSSTYNDGNWHLVVAEWSTSSGLTMFVDGSSVATNTCADCKTDYSSFGTGYWHFGSADLAHYTGAPVSGWSYFKGNLSGAAVFTSALSSSQVTTLYNSGSDQSYYRNVMADSPVQYWPLEDTSVSTTAADTSGNANTGTVKGGATLGVPPGGSSTSTSGADGEYFNGSGTAVDTTTSSTTFTSSTTVSVMGWFNTNSNNGTIIGNDNVQAESTSDNNVDYALYIGNDGKLHFSAYNSANSTWYAATSASTYTDGNWHFAVGEASSAGIKLYVDSASVVSNTSYTSPYAYSGGYWHLGWNDDCNLPNTVGSCSSDVASNYNFTGNLTELAVFPTALTATQVSTLYGETSPSALSTYTLSLSPTYYWPMQETSGTSASDTSGSSNTATLQSGVTAGDAGPAAIGGTGGGGGLNLNVYGQTLNGSTGWDQTTTSYNDPNNLSEVIWFKTTTSTGGVLFGFDNVQGSSGGSNNDRNIYLSNSGLLNYGVCSCSGLNVLTSTSAYNDGNWHMVVGEVGSSGMFLYVDGTLVAHNATYTTPQNYTGWWHLGGDGNFGNGGGWPNQPTSQYVNGSISEAAVVPSELSSSQINTLYNAGTPSAYSTDMLALSPTAYWAMQETSGTTVADSAANIIPNTATAQTGATVGAAGPTPLNSTAYGVAFNGSSGTVTTTTSYNPNTTFSLITWFKTSSGGGIAGFNNTQNPTSATSYGRGLYVDSTGKLDFALNAFNVANASNSTVTDGNWHFAVVTYSGNFSHTYTMYTDNTQATGSPGSASDSTNFTGYWGLGYTKTANWFNVPASLYFNGTIADTAVIPSVLTSTQVSTLYNETSQSAYASYVESLSPSWFLAMQQTTGTTLWDTSGNSNTGTAQTGTTVGSTGPTTLTTSSGGAGGGGTGNETTTTTTTLGSGPFGGGNPAAGANLNGSTGYVQTATSYSDPATDSLVAWFQTTTSSGGVIMGFGDTKNTSTTNNDRLLWMDNSGKLVWATYNGVNQIVTSASAYNDGTWHMAVAEIGSNGMQLYVDGTLVASNAAYTAPQNYAGYWHLGAENLASGWTDKPTSIYLNGSLTEMAVVPSDLTAAQIGTLYSAGSPQSYALDMRLLSPTASWPLQDAAGSTTVADTSGNGNTGTLVGSVTLGGSGPTQLSSEQSSSAVTLDSDRSAFVQTTTSYANPNNISQVAWFSTPSGWSLGNPIMSFDNLQSNANPTNYDRQVWVDNTGHVVYGVNNGTTQEVSSPGTYNDGNWHMVVAEIGASGQQLWVDGTEVASNNAVTTAQNFTGYWHLGFADSSGWADGNTDWDYDGSLAEAAVIPSQLTSSQIQTLYQAGNTAAYALDMAKLINGSTSGSYWPLQDSASNIGGTVEATVQQSVNGGTTYTCVWPTSSCITPTTTNLVTNLPTLYTVTAPGASTTIVKLTMQLSSAAGSAVSSYLIQPQIAFGLWKSTNNWSAQICYASSTVAL